MSLERGPRRSETILACALAISRYASSLGIELDPICHRGALGTCAECQFLGGLLGNPIGTSMDDVIPIALDYRSDRAEMRADVIAGLSAAQKTISCRWLYDDRGSELFEEITRLPEYYPTRIEAGILQKHVDEIADFVGEKVNVLEYGAGAGIKTEILLEALCNVSTYVPIDVAASFLDVTADRLRRRFHLLRVRPIVADFTADFAIPSDIAPERRVGFFLGSTIGNLETVSAHALLRRMRDHVGFHGKTLIGVDKKKDLRVLMPAYADAGGVTAQFNLNLLARMNRELGSDFKLDRFRHKEIWNEVDSAVEMYLESLAPQTVSIGHHSFFFRKGETIHTESSRKYDRASFEKLARRGGWTVDHAWSDDANWFSIFGMSVAR